MIRAAIYIRVSTEEQHLHGLSLEAQRDALTSYAKENGMQIVDIYADEGITARKRTDKRLEFQRLLKDVRQDKIDVILVTKLDRWFRNMKDYYKTQDVLEAHNCNWKTIFEEYDTSTAGGRLHVNIMLAVNQDECDRTSERIKAVFKHKIDSGEVISGSVPLGYKIENKRLAIVPEDAEIVHQIFNYFEKSGSVSATAQWASTNLNIKSYNRISRILSTEKYIGRSNGNDNFCPAIISKEQWDSVQRMRSSNRKIYSGKPNTTPVVYIFSGLLRCKDCGRKFVSGRMNKVFEGKFQAYKTYRCNKHFKHCGCDNSYVIPEKNVLEKYLVENIKKELEKHCVEFNVSDKKKKKASSTAAISKLKKKCDKLKDLYLDELIDKDTYKKDYEALQAQIKELQTEAPAESKMNTELVKGVLSMDFEQIYDTLTDLEKRRLWFSIIDYIEIGHNKTDIAIHFL